MTKVWRLIREQLRRGIVQARAREQDVTVPVAWNPPEEG
jgi:hypothetical protein